MTRGVFWNWGLAVSSWGQFQCGIQIRGGFQSRGDGRLYRSMLPAEYDNSYISLHTRLSEIKISKIPEFCPSSVAVILSHGFSKPNFTLQTVWNILHRDDHQESAIDLSLLTRVL